MNKDRKGILLTENMGLSIRVIRDSSGLITSGIMVGACVDQEVVCVLKSRPCDFKEDPILGPGLTQTIRSKYSSSEIELRIKQHLTRVGIDYEDYKDRLNITTN
jgi:hypothetical protein